PAAAAMGKDSVDLITSDQQLSDMSKQFDELNKKLDDAKSTRADQTQLARKVLDEALDKFEKQANSAGDMVRGNPELQSYVIAAQKFQETTRQLLDDLIRKQQSQIASLVELRTRLNEKMEKRRLEQWNNDQKLQDMNSELQILQRQYNAAVAGGLEKETAD